MSDSYVCSGAMMRCTMGTSPAQLTVLPSRTVFLCGQPMANISDHKSMVNLAPFGLCRSLGFPATASATAAHHGVLTPMPCVHNTPAPWMPGKIDYLIQSQPALLRTCKCQCMWGGMISLVTDGQVGEGTQYVQKKQGEDFELQQEDASGLDQNSVLDGIQLALDAAGFVPGFGAVPDLINASISALRGNWADAGMSLLAAVPLIGDAAAGVNIARKGVKAAKSIGKLIKLGKGESKVGVKTAESINTWWKKQGLKKAPYKPNTAVLEIKLTEKKTFVRVYDGETSGIKGGWMMEKESIEGLTPKQIQDKFALQAEPKYICDVEIPAETHLRKGITNTVEGWGNGGGIQYDMMAKQDVGTFMNERLLTR